MVNACKILHVIGKRPQGGIGTFLINMHSHINTSKVQFDYLINADDLDGEFDRKVKELGGEVFVLPKLSYKNTLEYLIELNKFFKKNNEYKAVHIHSVNIFVFNYLFARKNKIKHFIAHSHNTRYSDKLINSIRNFFLQIPVKKLANIYFACGKEAASFLFGKKLVEKGKVFIANNAIDSQKFRFDLEVRNKIRKELGLDGKFVIGNVAAFLPQKNHQFLIDIFYEVYKINKNAILVLVGNGELENEIKSKVKKNNLEKAVMFLGRRNDIDKIMQAFDVFLLPSKFEGFPLVGVEAQAAGLPCFFSDTITRDLKVTNDVKFLSINSSAKEWADEICNRIDNISRADTHELIVNSGYEVTSAAKSLENFYLDLE